jgi:arylsulfatase
MEHSVPITFPEDEAFDIGHDTRTGVTMLEYRYEPPFKFTGKINKITFNLEPEQLTDEDRKNMPAIAHAVANAKD